MPQRFLKPGITNSERWNSISWSAQSLFIRLLTIVDDYGRYDGRSPVIHGQCFSLYNAINPERPVKLQETDKMLQEIAATHLVDIYVSEGKTVLQITQWTERLREGVKEKWPARKLQEVAEDSCKNLPSPSSSPSSSDSSSTPLVLEVEIQKPKETSSQWLELLQKSEAYSWIDIKVEYSKAGIWCKKNRRRLTERFFLGWLNKKDKPLDAGPINGNEIDHPANGAQVILYNDEYKRVLDGMKYIRAQYQDHQSWSKQDTEKFQKLRSRKTELKKLLGIVE